MQPTSQHSNSQLTNTFTSITLALRILFTPCLPQPRHVYGGHSSGHPLFGDSPKFALSLFCLFRTQNKMSLFIGGLAPSVRQKDLQVSDCPMQNYIPSRKLFPCWDCLSPEVLFPWILRPSFWFPQDKEVQYPSTSAFLSIPFHSFPGSSSPKLHGESSIHLKPCIFYLTTSQLSLLT